MRASQINIKTKQNGVITYANPPKVLFATSKMRIVQIAKRGLPGASAATRVIDEVPTGAINGSNATFTTSQNFKPESVEVTLNGLGQRKGSGFDYITSGNNTIIFAVSPDSGDTILVDYEVA